MTTPAAELRTHLADTLANIDGWEWAPGFDKKQSPSYQGYLRQADAVLAAFPAAALAVARQVLGTTTEQPVAEAAVDGPFPQQEWQKTPCPRCKGKHPRHCPDCPNDPPCADHVCSWPDNEEDEQPEAEAPAVDLRDRIAQALTDWAYRSSDRKYAALRRDETVRANAYSRADAVLAVLPAPADRAAILHEAADALAESETLRDLTDDHMHDVNAAASELRRLADEAQQPTDTVVCVHPEHYEGECPCPPSCICCQPAPAVTEQPVAEELTAAEQQFLAYALHLADDQMATRGDEFGDDDRAALVKLQRLAKAGCTCGRINESWIKTPHAVDCPAAPTP